MKEIILLLIRKVYTSVFSISTHAPSEKNSCKIPDFKKMEDLSY